MQSSKFLHNLYIFFAHFSWYFVIICQFLHNFRLYEDDIPREVLTVGRKSRFGFSKWEYITEPEVMGKIYDLDVKYCQVIERVSSIFVKIFIIKTQNNKSHLNHDHYLLVHIYALCIKSYLNRKIIMMMMTKFLISLMNKYLLALSQARFCILMIPVQIY